MLYPLFSTMPARYELLFLIETFSLGAENFGPFVFTLADLPTMNPLIATAMGGAFAETRVNLRPAGVFTGFTQVRGGVLYVDVYAPTLPEQRCPMLRLPGSVLIQVGQLATVCALYSDVPFTGSTGVAQLFRSVDEPTNFASIVPMAGQLLRVVELFDDYVVVVGVRRHICSGYQSVEKAPANQILGLSQSFPIGYGYEAGTDANVDYVWKNAVPYTVLLAIGAPVVGPTLVQLLSDVGPAISPAATTFKGTIDAQAGGVILAAVDVPPVSETTGTGFGIYVGADASPILAHFEPTQYAPATSQNVLNYVASEIHFYNTDGTFMMLELLDTIMTAGAYPVPGP